jgi:ABC-type glycerol-3-phosphate transport system substrate-binding protein
MSQASDCFIWFPSTGILLSETTFNLTPFLETDSSFPLDDFYPQALNAFRWHNDLWALPADIQMMVLYYNKARFDAAGIPYPQTGWSLDDFLATAELLTQGTSTDKQYGYVPLNGNTGDLPTFIALWGASWVDHTFTPSRFHFTDPMLIEALQWYADLAHVHQITPIFPEEDPAHPNTTAWLKRQNLIQTGQAAMWISTPEFGSFSNLPPDMDIGVASLPLKQEKVPFATVLGYYISKETPYPQHCWSWITFLTEQSLSAASNLPPRRSIAESLDFSTKVGSEVASAYLYSIERAQANQTPVGPTAIPGYYWLYEAYGQAMDGISAQTALEQAQKKTTAYFACLESHANFEDESLQKSCAMEADPECVWFGADGS